MATALTPASNLHSKIDELKGFLADPFSKKSPATSSSPDLQPTSKRRRDFSPISDLDFEDAEDALKDVDPSTIRAFNYLFDKKLSEAVKPYINIIEELRDIIADKDGKIQALEAQLAAYQENSATDRVDDANKADIDLSEFQRRLDEQDHRQDVHEQRLRMNHVRMHGVPNSDNCDELVCKIAQSVGVDLCTRDFHISHYMQSSDPAKKGRQILVDFVNNRDKVRLLSNRKKLREPTNEYRKVFINEDLTRPRYNTLRALQAKRKEGKIHAAWSYRGKIFYKRTDSQDEKPTLVKNVLTFVVDNL